MCFFLGGTITHGKLPLKVLSVLACHGAPTGAPNSSLGYPNMAAAALGKNFPKAIPSLLHVFNGWYLQGLDIWCYLCPGPRIFGVNNGTSPDEGVIFHRRMPESKLVDARNSDAWKNEDARDSGKMTES